MKHRRAADRATGTGLGFGGRMRRSLAVAALAVALLGVAPAGQAFAQESSGGSIDIGGSIAATVASAVASIATDSDGGSASGGVSVESNEASFGEQEGLSIADASGGNNNASAKTK